MNQNPENDLEQFIHKELSRLPNLPAPPDLAARVAKALERRQKLPWWRKSLWDWPAPARVAALAFFSSCALLPTLAAFFLLNDWSAVFHRLTASLAVPSDWLAKAGAGGTLVAQYLQSFSTSPWLLGAFLFFLVMYLILIGTGSAFVRLAMNRSHGS